MLALTLALVRRGLLTARYALGWVCVSVVAILGAPLFAFLSTQVAFIKLSPAGFSIVVAILFLLAICVQLSVSLSGLVSSTQDIAERLALVEAANPGRTAGVVAPTGAYPHVGVSMRQGDAPGARGPAGEAHPELVSQ